MKDFRLKEVLKIKVVLIKNAFPFSSPPKFFSPKMIFSMGSNINLPTWLEKGFF